MSVFRSFLCGGALLLLGLTPCAAAEVAPQFNISARWLWLTDEVQESISCWVAAQSADGSFSCRDASSGRAVSGKLSGITNSFGAIVGHQITYTVTVSANESLVFTGALRTINDHSYFSAGTYKRYQVRRIRLTTGQILTTTNITGPFPYRGDHTWYDG